METQSYIVHLPLMEPLNTTTPKRLNDIKKVAVSLHPMTDSNLCISYSVARPPNAVGDNIQKLQGTRLCNSSKRYHVLPPLPSPRFALRIASVTSVTSRASARVGLQRL
jgi:hypothetical protein